MYEILCMKYVLYSLKKIKKNKEIAYRIATLTHLRCVHTMNVLSEFDIKIYIYY